MHRLRLSVGKDKEKVVFRDWNKSLQHYIGEDYYEDEKLVFEMTGEWEIEKKTPDKIVNIIVKDIGE